MRYYVYVSDIKIDMLFEQLPKKWLDHAALELKIDAKILAGSLKKDPSTETRYHKLKLVIEALRASGEIGNYEAPKSYFSGSMAMGWGPPKFMHLADEKAELMVLFGGSPDGKQGVALIGSAAHLLGEVGTPVHAFYARPQFLQKLAHGIQDFSEKEFNDNIMGTYNLAREVSLFPEGATHPVEFVEKYLLQRGDTLIGTPLYVAIA